MGGLTNFTSTSLGYLIAYVLPGFGGLYAASLFTTSLGPISHEFEVSAVGLGLFLAVLLAAITVGLVLSAVVWVIYEKGFLTSRRLVNTGFVKLDNSEKLAIFRMLIDELYRYYQFYGAISLVFPVVAIKLSLQHAIYLSWWQLLLTSLILAGVEIVLVSVAVDCFKRCVSRQTELLG